MRYIQEKKASRLGYIFTVSLLMVAMLVLAPNTAYANACVDATAAADTVAGWKQDAENFLLNQAQWITQNYAAATAKAANIASQQLQAQVNVAGTQAVVDGQRVAVNAGGVAQINTNMQMPRASQACALHRTTQVAGRAAATTLSAIDLITAIAAHAGTGTKADTTSPAYFATEVDDLCRLGFIDIRPGSQFAAFGQKYACKDLSDTPVHAKLINKHKFLSSVIGKLQYPLPNLNNTHMTPDGHLSFTAQGGNPMASPDEKVAGLGSEMDWVAAFKYCQHLGTPRSPAAQSTANSQGVNDVMAVWNDGQNGTNEATAKDECMRALAYRTSCPASLPANELQDQSQGGLNCHQVQQQLCDHLSQTQPLGGNALSLAGDDPIYATALANCDDQGISQAMYDAIMARRCNDDNFTLSMANTLGSAAALEHATDFDCPAVFAKWQDKMDSERERLEAAVHIIGGQ